MLVGPDLLVTLAPHSGSRSLARRLRNVATRPASMTTGTHIGLWAGVDAYPGRWNLGATRDPVAWHVAHFGHWCRGSGGEHRLAPWMAPGVAALALDAAQQHGTLEAASLHSPGLLDALWTAYLGGVTDPGTLGAAGEHWPESSSWPRTSEMSAPAVWMGLQGCGLATWGYVRQFYATHLWGRSLDWLAERPDIMLVDALIDCAQLDEGLEEVAEVWGLELADEPGAGSSAASHPLVSPTPEQVERIHAAEWFIYRMHPGYLDGTAPPVVWTNAGAR